MSPASGEGSMGASWISNVSESPTSLGADECKVATERTFLLTGIVKDCTVTAMQRFAKSRMMVFIAYMVYESNKWSVPAVFESPRDSRKLSICRKIGFGPFGTSHRSRANLMMTGRQSSGPPQNTKHEHQKSRKNGMVRKEMNIFITSLPAPSS